MFSQSSLVTEMERVHLNIFKTSLRLDNHAYRGISANYYDYCKEFKKTNDSTLLLGTYLATDALTLKGKSMGFNG